MLSKDTVHDLTMSLTLETAKKLTLGQERAEVDTVDILFAIGLQTDAASIVLKGLLRQRGGLVYVGPNLIPKLIPALVPIDPETLTFARPVNRAIEKAAHEAAVHGGFRNDDGLIEVASDHLLVALAEDEDCAARAILSRCGVKPAAVREAVYSCFPH